MHAFLGILQILRVQDFENFELLPMVDTLLYGFIVRLKRSFNPDSCCKLFSKAVISYVHSDCVLSRSDMVYVVFW